MSGDENAEDLGFLIYDPGDPRGDDDPPEIGEARDALEALASAQGFAFERNTFGVQAGDGVTLSLVIAAVATGAASGFGKAMGQELGRKALAYLRAMRTRKHRSGGEPAASIKALELGARAMVHDKTPGATIDPILIQRASDGEKRHATIVGDIEDCEGFPTGVFLFRIPELSKRETHVIEIRSNGEVIAHEVRSYLTDDVLFALNEPMWSSKPRKKRPE